MYNISIVSGFGINTMYIESVQFYGMYVHAIE